MKKDLELFNVAQLIVDIKRLITDTHSVLQVKDYYNYTGIDLTHGCVLCNSFTLKEAVEKESIEWNKEDGRDLLEIIILKIFQLGYQQGFIDKTLKCNEEKKDFNELIEEIASLRNSNI